MVQLIGDGVTDTTDAAQQLINNGAGGTVFFPAGRFLVSMRGGFWCLNVPENTRVVGGPGTVFVLAGSQPAVARIFNAAANNITFERISLDGNKANQAQSEHQGGIIVTGSFCTIADVHAKEFMGDGFYLYNGADRFYIGNSSASNCDRNGVTLGGDISGGLIVDCEFTGSRASQVDTEAPNHLVSDIEIIRTKMDGLGNSNIPALTVGSQLTTTETTNSSNYYIYDCDITDGILATWCDDLTIQHCRITGSKAAPIAIQRKCSHVNITDNVITDSSYSLDNTAAINVFGTGEGGASGVYISRNNIVVTGPDKAFGIRVEGIEIINIIDNTITGPGVFAVGSAGITVRATNAVVKMAYVGIANNRVTDFGCYGLVVMGNGVSEITKLEVSGNTFTDTHNPPHMIAAMALNNDSSGAVKETIAVDNIIVNIPAEFRGVPAGVYTEKISHHWKV
jgi:hypothetical protein